MGNSQSTSSAPASDEPPRKPSQKLSKPKTGNHATAGLLSPGAFSNTPRRLSNAQLPTPPPPISPTIVSTPTTASVIEPSAGLERRVETGVSLSSAPSPQKESKRRSLFRSRSSRPSTGTVRRNHSVGPGLGFVDRLTRASSMTYESAVAFYGQAGPENLPDQPSSRTSWNYNLTSYEAQRLLNLAEEPPLEKASAMSENKTTVVTETTWKSSHPANPPSTTITRASSDVSLYMPVRRQSIIQTPGVATRSDSARDVPPLPNLNFRHSHPPTPSLSRQPSFESHRSGVVSMPPRIQDPDTMPRVVTPCEEQYQSIGAFKLGSLRITNGTPSPVSPEVRTGRGHGQTTAGEASGQDGYFTGAQARDTGASAAETAQHPVQAPRPRSLQPRPLGTLFVDHVVEGNVSDSSSVPKYSGAAPEFLPGINFSPLLSPDDPSQPASPLKTTSKVTALEDQLFDDEPQPEYSSIEVLDVRLDPNAKPPHPKVEPDAGKIFTRTDSGFVSTTSPSSESHKPLTKADSGYSSNVSLRSFQTKVQSAENQLVVSLEKPSPESNQRDAPARPASSQTEGHDPVAPQRDAPPPPVPPKDPPQRVRGDQLKPKTLQRKSLSVNSLAKENNNPSTADTSSGARHLPAPISSLPSGDRGPMSPNSIPPTPGSAMSSKSCKSTSALSIGSGSQKPSRLQRLLSGARLPAAGPPTVHATHAVEQSSIPPVPRDVEAKLREHSGLLPTAVRRLSLKPRSSLDTLKTIFSVGSIEASLEAVNSMRAADTARESEPKEGAWKQTLQSVPTSIANAAAHVIARKPINRKPVPARPDSAKERGQEPTKGLGRKSFDAGVVRGRSASSSHAVGGQATGRTSQPSGRTMSLTLPGERGLNLGLAADLPSPPLPSPLAKARSAQSNPVNPSPLTTPSKRPLSLRVPPPLRSESSITNLRGKASRESMQSYSAAQPLSRRSSRETISSYYSNQQVTASGSGHSSPGGITMDPRRLMSFRQFNAPQTSLPRSPNWETQANHAMAHRGSQTPTSGGSRRNSISSVQSFDGYGVQRPSSAQDWQVRTVQQPLRHRASYDGYSHQQPHPRYGYPPSMSNGYTAPSKPVYDPRVRGQLEAASTWSRSQLDAAAGQWYQNGGYPPYVPRGHYRNRSMGSRNPYGPNPPYRVLHSYNSPAYRNAPIWG